MATPPNIPETTFDNELSYAEALTSTSTQFNDPTARLSLPYSARLPLATGTGLFLGAGLGIAQGGKNAALRFRAENAHRLPTTQNGWYFYHKSKSYVTALGAIKEAARMGLYVAIISTTFCAMEQAVDVLRGDVADGIRGRGRWAEKSFLEDEEVVRYNGQADVGSTVLAAMGTTGLFCAFQRLPLPTAARTAKLGLKIGLGLGLGQDLVSILRGRRLDYVDWISSTLLGTKPG